MMSDMYAQLERSSLVGDAFALSPLPPFYVDAPIMFHLPPEMYQLRRCQDVTLVSYVETSGIDHYYSSLCGPPAQPPCQPYGPSYVRKRNERERQRVRCVNEGYTRLRKHLPGEYTEKRLSKVQTLRAAITYIHHLQEALRWENMEDPGDHLSNCTNTQRSDP